MLSAPFRTVVVGSLAVAICSTLLIGCADGDDPGQAGPDAAPFSLIGLDGHEATEAVFERVGERYGLDCEQSWEAAIDVTGLDPNYPEGSGLAEGSAPTSEILEAIREAGSEPESFEHWHVTATRAVFASFDIVEGWNALPEVIQVLWLGYDAKGGRTGALITGQCSGPVERGC